MKSDPNPNMQQDIPLVSVCVLTYNHDQYIETCLNSIISQKTSFNFEIILGEDDSTDNTRNICRSYATKYPDLIRLFLRKREDVIYIQGKPTGRFNFTENIKSARGKYIALCDGDDYWTSSSKLETQVNIFKKHPDVNICHHEFSTYRDHKIIENKSKLEEGKYGLEKLLAYNTISTASCMFRRDLFTYFPDWYYNAPYADYPLHILNALSGKIYFLKEPMSVFRIHSGGIWSNKQRSYKAKSTFEFLKQIQKEIDLSRHQEIVLQHMYEHAYRVAYSSPTTSQDFKFFYRYLRSNHQFKLKNVKRILVVILHYLGLYSLKEDANM